MRGNVNVEGEFDIKNVPPGEYVLQVSGPRSREGEERASSPPQFITVDGRDIGDLQLRASPGSTTGRPHHVRGLVRHRLRPRRGLESRPRLSVDVDHAAGRFDGPLAAARDDRQARLDRSSCADCPGSGSFGWFGSHRAGSLKAVRVNGIDVTDTPLAFGTRAESLDDVEMVLTRAGLGSVRPSGGLAWPVRGRLRRGVLRPIATVGALASRFVKFARSAPDGAFSVRGLPPGDYHVAAVDRLLEGIGEWQDPDFLESVAPSAVRITIPEGQQLIGQPEAPDSLTRRGSWSACRRSLPASLICAAAVSLFSDRMLAAPGAQDLIARARAIHDRVITLDTHNDIDPLDFTPAATTRCV